MEEGIVYGSTLLLSLYFILLCVFKISLLLVPICIYPTPLQHAKCDIRSLCKEGTTGFNSEFSFSKPGCHTNIKSSVCPTIYA